MPASRVLFIAHRYLGIAVGIVMVIWCLSGFVMMYVPYPQLSEDQRVAHLPPITWNRCCFLAEPSATEAMNIAKVQAEMLAGRAVARITTDRGVTRLFDLLSGNVIRSVSEEEAVGVASGFAPSGDGLTPLLIGRINYDQWTVQGARGKDRPLFRLELRDPAATELYVSSVTGKAIQLTTAHERFWNWLGSVPHWIYFTSLRQDAALWTQVVVWTSVVGCFLTLTGVYVGIRQLGSRKALTRIPYSGLHYWHHLLGLFFGLFVLTWVASGLISMNPWGFLEGGDFDEPQRLRGASASMRDIESGLTAMARLAGRPAIVAVESAPLGGHLFLVGTRADGTRFRVDSNGVAAPLSNADLQMIGATLDSGHRGFSLSPIRQEDAYYFSHHRDQAALPVFRVIVNDAGRTRYYLDPVSGQIRARFDRDAQGYRWLHQALHRMDFSAGMRSRPLWDTVTLFLLAGTTTVCLFGAYLGVRRLI